MGTRASRDLASARSFLFVPGDRPERFSKAVASGTDVVIVDLEDAVPAERKPAAREAVESWLAAGNHAVVRVNGIGTEWHDEDVAAVRDVAWAIMLPKAQSAHSWSSVRGLKVMPLIETARGVLEAPATLAAPGILRPAFGSIDLAAELGVDPDDRQALSWVRASLTVAAAAAGLPAPVDGVTTSLTDHRALTEDVLASRRLGLTAKLCIHPSQVQVVHELLRPSADEVAWAREVLAAAPDGGAVAVGGRMVDAPVRARAQRILDLL